MILTLIPNELYIGDISSFYATDFIKNTISIIFDSSDIYPTKKMREFYDKHNIIYIKSNTIDDENYNIIAEFEKLIHEITNESVVLIICNCAISRSVSYAILYLLKIKNMYFYDALIITKRVVNNMSPNIGFIKQIIQYEHQLFGINSLNVKEYIKLHFKKIK